jgi:raffinose/stachyose/melibiose transport system permease protein
MKKIGTYIFLLLFALYAILPLFIVILGSVKTEKEMFTNILGFPDIPKWKNHSTVWVRSVFNRFFINSVLITIPTVLLVVSFPSLADYAFSEMRFKGKEVIFFIFLIGLMIPVPSLLIPLYKNLNLFNLLDTRIGVILPQAAIVLPFGIFLMRTFFIGIKDEILEAARIDGANELKLIARVTVPLASPGLKALSLISFMWAWQE